MPRKWEKNPRFCTPRTVFFPGPFYGAHHAGGKFGGSFRHTLIHGPCPNFNLKSLWTPRNWGGFGAAEISYLGPKSLAGGKKIFPTSHKFPKLEEPSPWGGPLSLPWTYRVHFRLNSSLTVPMFYLVFTILDEKNSHAVAKRYPSI